MSPDSPWRDIPGHPDYLAHEDGFVYSYLSNRVLAPGQTRGGYETLGLSEDGKVTQWRVNRLICLSFHGTPPHGKPFALHNNGDHLDNRATNLRWGSPKENMEDAIRHGTHTSIAHRKTHCPQGHPYDIENTLNLKNGGRRCRECKRADSSRRRGKSLPEGDKRHGTMTGYTGWGCRCDPCRAVHRDYGMRRKTTKENN